MHRMIFLIEKNIYVNRRKLNKKAETKKFLGFNEFEFARRKLNLQLLRVSKNYDNFEGLQHVHFYEPT